ncbi:MAG: LLM class flavin-dependent oxidoreductase [Gammaproteobacteria bacterium]|nr:LLM class flavin-dependent oxidoreductase [Gammaproteobacteria bacterium]
MKFGVFLPNGSNGYIPSAGSPVYLPTYQHNLDISLEAERVGLDFVLSMMKFRGFGGDTGYWDACLESFTLMAGIAAATRSIGLFPSISILSQHPAVVARMVATIDDISGGRCGLNIVTGWNRAEYAQMGLWPGDEHYERRYDYASEYLAILKTLWRDGRCTHRGEHFQLDDCTVYPRPGREIPIVCAGQSPRGRAFVAAHADQQFVLTGQSNLKAGVADIKARAAAAGREVGIYALFHMILADSDAAARAEAEHIVASADHGALASILASAGLDTNTDGTADQLKAALTQPIEEGNLAFMGIPVVLGTPRTVAARIDEIAADTGIDGMLFSWPDFVPGVRRFGEEVLPLLTCRG